VGVPEQSGTDGRQPLVTRVFVCPVKLWQFTVKQWCDTVFHENVVWLAEWAAASHNSSVFSVVSSADDLLQVASKSYLTA
jgi:hypothetical protein